jgi:hypothetical protein
VLSWLQACEVELQDGRVLLVDVGDVENGPAPLILSYAVQVSLAGVRHLVGSAGLLLEKLDLPNDSESLLLVYVELAL